MEYSVLYVCTYKQYGCNTTYNYCCKCVQYGLINTDGADSAYNGFIRNTNKNS